MVLRASGSPEPFPAIGRDSDNVLGPLPHCRGPKRRCSTCAAARLPGTTSSSTRRATFARPGRNWPNASANAGTGGLQQLRAVVRGLVDNDGITYVQVDRTRRRDHQRRRHRGARSVAPRRTAAGGVGPGLGRAGIGPGAALPAARRRAHRPVRRAPVDHQRGAARSAALRPSGLRPRRARHRGARPAPAVPARLRRQPRRARANSWSTPTGRRRRRVRATRWPTGA